MKPEILLSVHGLKNQTVALARPHWAEGLPKVHIKTPHLTQIHMFEEQVLMVMQMHWN
jgi:hypothetical protein